MELLPATCYVIIGFCIIMYVLLDGFDLGIGILFPFFNKHDKDIMMSTILPVWDGNQTWLVLGGAILFGAFPLAFSLILPMLYLPLILMVTALLLRGITFEFRLKETSMQPVWSAVFFFSSVIIVLIQGIVLGTFVKGFEVSPQGKLIFTLFTPFNISCGIALLFGYSLLGATWIIGKTVGPLQEKMYRIAFVCLWVVAAFLAIISLWTPYVDPSIWGRWFGVSQFKKLIWLPVITAAIIYYFNSCIRKKREFVLYWLTVGIFLCAYLGFGISTWPYIIPHQITIWQAASPPPSQLFLLIGTLLLLPVLLIYTAYAYYIFKGKVTEVIDYH